MRVKIVCSKDYEMIEVELPMDEKQLLKIQGDVLDRDTDGYILGNQIKYFDENGDEIENVFLLNKSLK